MESVWKAQWVKLAIAPTPSEPYFPGMPKQQTVTRARLIAAARNLKSEDGENPEYDRALVELISDAVGPRMGVVAKELGIKPLPHFAS